MKLKSWVETFLILWCGVDFLLVTMALYMQRVLELGL